MGRWGPRSSPRSVACDAATAHICLGAIMKSCPLDAVPWSLARPIPKIGPAARPITASAARLVQARSGSRVPTAVIIRVAAVRRMSTRQSSRFVDPDVQRPRAHPFDVDVAFDRRGGGGGAEISGAAQVSGHRRVERPDAGRVAVPHRSVGGGKRRRGEVAQCQHVAAGERKSHHTEPGEPFVVSGRQAGVLDNRDGGVAGSRQYSSCLRCSGIQALPAHEAFASTSRYAAANQLRAGRISRGSANTSVSLAVVTGCTTS